MECASIAVFNSDGHLLVGLRKDTWKWNLPGGRIEEGEKPEQAAVRELREETGIRVPQKDLVFLGAGKTSNGVLVFSFEVRVDRRRPTTKHDPDEECVCWTWVDCKNGLPSKYKKRWNCKTDITLELLGLDYGQE